MASQVKSQLSDKIYESTLDDLLESDQGLEVDLYKINIFNKDIHIAPGKIMNDVKKDIYYCFVYAIKDKKVAAKIGVYETREPQGEVYDLSLFEEGTLLLFDYYIQEPTALVEYQVQEEPVGSDNVFDYLKRYIKPVTNEAVTMKTQKSIITNITMRISRRFSDQTELLDLLKLFRISRPYDEEFLDSLKDEAPDRLMFILIVLEQIFGVKFKFDLDGADELRNMVKEKPNTSTDIIHVSLEDGPRVVNKNAGTALVKNEGTSLEEDAELLVTPGFKTPTQETLESESPVRPRPEPIKTRKPLRQVAQNVVTSDSEVDTPPARVPSEDETPKKPRPVPRARRTSSKSESEEEAPKKPRPVPRARRTSSKSESEEEAPKKPRPTPRPRRTPKVLTSESEEEVPKKIVTSESEEEGTKKTKPRPTPRPRRTPKVMTSESEEEALKKTKTKVLPTRPISLNVDEPAFATSEPVKRVSKISEEGSFSTSAASASKTKVETPEEPGTKIKRTSKTIPKPITSKK